ncbi:DUF3788 family protein [Anaerorhabdus furcosa]|uniref:DUF3788 domain-containing protein n=1 Tax=Anaerorhabdus furcosa TaxID=118967 RepID=A0A1T4KLD4_9FIRM|nr:DUF3788 family protein [Anaerorhabdus furcosa]SJZ43252.1 Protein of unknown function [Anaerorhabdus furcosa]
MMVNELNQEELESIIGKKKTKLFKKLNSQIHRFYQLDELWCTGGKNWDYEYKIKSKSKSFCSFLFKENVLGFMIIFGKDERVSVEEKRLQFSKEILEKYDNASTFHDGKWVLFEINSDNLNDQFLKLLEIKRKPNVK